MNHRNLFIARFFCFIALIFFYACQTPQTPAATSNVDSSSMAGMTTTTYDISLVNNKKDPVCGMPVTAGISDTAHYQKNVLGFCSPECKAEFLQNPESMLAAAEIKEK